MKEIYCKTGNRKLLPLLTKVAHRYWCYLLTFMLLWFLAIPANSQIVTEGATVKAWFGIDADIYSNILTVNDEGFASPEFTDDWFKNEDFPGSTRGLGVIDTTGAAYWTSQVLGNYNTSFGLRMSKENNWEDPSNYEIWIDAVYFRDWNSQGKFKDSTVFTSGSDANGANPSSWSLGTGGTPQKNDLVDVMGHMRKNITTGDLFGIGAFTTFLRMVTRMPILSFSKAKLVMNLAHGYSGSFCATDFGVVCATDFGSNCASG